MKPKEHPSLVARSSMIAAALALLVASGSSDAADAAAKLKYASPTAVVFSEASCEGDWLEIQNTDGKLTANISGWVIADSLPLEPTKAFHFAKVKTIKPGAKLLVKASSLPFSLGCGSDNVYLMRNKSVVVDQVTVPNLTAGYTWGRLSGRWQATLPTPAAANIAAPADAVVDRAAWLFSPLKSYTVKLTVDPQQLENLKANSGAYVPAQFQVQDAEGSVLPASGPLAIGLRVKGTVGTRTDPIFGVGGLNIVNDKVSLKLKFNFSIPGQRFFGLKKLTLNSMLQDPSMVHETLSYKLFRDMGLPAARTGFANVSINGSPRGFFLSLEPYDEVSMAWSTPTLAHVYEGQWGQSGGVWYSPDSPATDISVNFHPDAGDKKNLADITKLIAAVKDGSAVQAGSHARLQLEQAGSFFAIEKFANHWDGYSGSVPWAPNNFSMVSDRTGEFRFLPGGTDTTWWLVPGREGLDANGAEPFETGAASMFKLCLQTDACASAYRRTLARAALEAPALQAFAAQLVTLHTADRSSDPLRLIVTRDFIVRHATETDTARELAEVQSFITKRPAAVAAYLKTVVTGEIRWTPSTLKLAKGTRLTTAQLNAYSDVLGTFTYSSALGTKLPVGKTTVTVTFTPNDPQLTGPQTTSRVFTVS